MSMGIITRSKFTMNAQRKKKKKKSQYQKNPFYYPLMLRLKLKQTVLPPYSIYTLTEASYQDCEHLAAKHHQ